MAYSKIVITFDGAASIGSTVFFKYRDNSIVSLPIVDCSSEWVTVKYQKGQVQKSSTLPYTFMESAIDYVTAFNVDYNVPQVFTVTRSLSVVTIEAKKDGIEFYNFTTNDPVNIFEVITNETYVDPYVINTLAFSAASVNPVCTHITTTVTTNNITTDVTSPVISSPASTTFSFEWVRGVTYTLANTDGVTALSRSVTAPTVLESAAVQIIKKPSGASILLSNDNNLDLTLTYSLNGVDYQTSKLFTGVLEGSYTVYVKDSYGCIRTTAIVVDAYTPEIDILTPYVYISNCNALRFKKYEIWDYKDIYKTEYNTLSYEERKPLSNTQIYKYKQKFQSNDTIVEQFICNYETISARTISSDGDTALTVEKKTNNIGLQDRRDVRVFEMADGKTGLYFIAGNIYDYVTDEVSGSYATSSPYPDWAVINRNVYIEVLDTYLTIENIVFDTTRQKDILVLEAAYTGVEIETRTDVNYNLFPWEVYEFTIDMSAYEGKTFQVAIELTDSVFSYKDFLSEIIEVKELHNKTVEIIYKNSEDNDIIWSTGLMQRLRLEYVSFNLVSESEREIHKTDTNVIPLSDDTYNKKELKLTRLSTMMADKVMKALSNDYLMIDRELYTKESIASPEPIAGTNLYNISTILYKTEEEAPVNYNDVGLTILEVGDIPQLFDYGNGFLTIN